MTSLMQLCTWSTYSTLLALHQLAQVAIATAVEVHILWFSYVR